jgi:transcription antitermination protein NusB
VGKRHQARELALKTLFQLEGAEDETEEVLRYHAFEGGATPDVATFALQLVEGVIANREKLDAILSEASDHWKLDQMAKVDRIILRIAVYEIAIDRRVPTKAAINESIELAKTFSGDESGRFVNGILGRVAASSASAAATPAPKAN